MSPPCWDGIPGRPHSRFLQMLAAFPSRTRPVRMKRWLPAGLFLELLHVRWAVHPYRGQSLTMPEEACVQFCTFMSESRHRGRRGDVMDVGDSHRRQDDGLAVGLNHCCLKPTFPPSQGIDTLC